MSSSPLDLSNSPIDSKPLTADCQRHLGWREAYSNRVFGEYCKFLAMKVRLNDFGASKIGASKLVPSLAINKIWQQHVLDTRRYHNDCYALCGRMIHYNRDADDTSASKLKRIRTTKGAYRLIFGKKKPLTSEIWRFGSLPEERDISHGRDPLDDQEEEPAELTTLEISVQDENGNSVWFKLRGHTKIRKVFHRYAERMGVKESSISFFFDECCVNPNFTPTSMDMPDGAVIEAISVKKKKYLSISKK
eukprot:CAMPEP_0119024304 /NCGR_PEP_ID=MMETSP1176-20130426/31609_1 /TAXON_ID=265551 /ORGANISM="Synedropsis recta cf, Strain CCMP1620" /LENGTH=247 /DNA_ID=CAMNT_0006979563 /DNA_START=66 /DNA_END=809 /DNA_ORIENTATION=-